MKRKMERREEKRRGKKYKRREKGRQKSQYRDRTRDLLLMMKGDQIVMFRVFLGGWGGGGIKYYGGSNIFLQDLQPLFSVALSSWIIPMICCQFFLA